VSNQSSAKLYKDILETIRMTIPEPYRPDAYSDISGAINLWMESQHKHIKDLQRELREHDGFLTRERELRESAQAVTRKLQDEQDPPMGEEQMREYMREEYREFATQTFEMFMYFTKGKRIIIEDMEG
jgi:hypothetical protein